MYTGNYCVSTVSPINYTYTPQYQPVSNTEEISNGFQAVLSNTIYEATPPLPYQTSTEYPPYQTYPEYPQYQTDTEYPPYQTYPEYPSCKTDTEPPPINVTNNYPINSIPPVISVPPVATAQAVTGPSFLSRYYPIPESEVIPKIIEVRHIINNTNMSAKSDIEKYNFIESRFVDAFGKDFRIARDLFLPSSMYYMIGVEFNDTLGRHIENPEQVNRQRLHGNASTESIHDTIRNRFPTELTNRDLFLMVGQMRNEGVLDTASIRSLNNGGTRRLMDTLSMLRNYARFSVMPKDNMHRPLSLEERDRRWADLLNNAISIHDLLGTFNVWKEYGRVDVGADVTPFLVKHTGGELGENGLFKLDAHDDMDWNRLMDMMLAEFNEQDELVRRRLNDIDAAFTAGVGENIVLVDIPGAEENIESEYTPGAEENIVPEYTPGAEENLDTGDTDDNNTDEVVESNPEAA